MASLALWTSVGAIPVLRCCGFGGRTTDTQSFFFLSYRILGRLFIGSSTCDTGSNPQGTRVFVLSIDKVDGLMA